jgi:hypothetical protein
MLQLIIKNTFQYSYNFSIEINETDDDTSSVTWLKGQL